MRLYNEYYLCKEYIDQINAFGVTGTENSHIYEINDWQNYKSILLTLSKIPILNKLVISLIDAVPVYVREKAKPQIDVTIKNQLESNLSSIKIKMRTIIELYESMNLGENENGIDVKIPQCESLDEYIRYLKEIDFIFEQCPFLSSDDEKIKFNTVDVGSQWITFMIEVSAGVATAGYILKNLASIIDKAIQLRSHFLNLKEHEERLKTRKIQNNIAESEIEMFDYLRKQYLAEAVNDLEKENKETPLENGEVRGKVEKSLDKMCGLLEKGVEFYASIDTNKEIQVLFPVMEDKLKLEDKIKFIENKD